MKQHCSLPHVYMKTLFLTYFWTNLIATLTLIQSFPYCTISLFFQPTVLTRKHLKIFCKSSEYLVRTLFAISKSDFFLKMINVTGFQQMKKGQSELNVQVVYIKVSEAFCKLDICRLSFINRAQNVSILQEVLTEYDFGG